MTLLRMLTFGAAALLCSVGADNTFEHFDGNGYEEDNLVVPYDAVTFPEIPDATDVPSACYQGWRAEGEATFPVDTQFVKCTESKAVMSIFSPDQNCAPEHTVGSLEMNADQFIKLFSGEGTDLTATCCKCDAEGCKPLIEPRQIHWKFKGAYKGGLPKCFRQDL